MGVGADLTRSRGGLDGELTALFAGDPDACRDPYPLYHRLRAFAPIYAHGSIFVITGYPEAKGIYRDAVGFPQPRIRGIPVPENLVNVSESESAAYVDLVGREEALGQFDGGVSQSGDATGREGAAGHTPHAAVPIAVEAAHVVGLEPDRLDLNHKNARDNIALGYGAHRCLGAAVAKLEVEAILEALARRFPDLALAVPSDDLESNCNPNICGLRALPVGLRPEA